MPLSSPWLATPRLYQLWNSALMENGLLVPVNIDVLINIALIFSYYVTYSVHKY